MPLLVTSISSQIPSRQEVSPPRAIFLGVYMFLSSLPFQSTILLKIIPPFLPNLFFVLLWTAIILPLDRQVVERVLKPQDRLAWLQGWYLVGQMRGWTIWIAALCFVWAYVEGDGMGWWLSGGAVAGLVLFGWVCTVLRREIQKEKLVVKVKGHELLLVTHEDVVVGDRVSAEWVGADA